MEAASTTNSIQKGVPLKTHAPTGTANGTSRAKNNEQIIRSRMTKNSVSPDKYHINNNLVVQLADPIRKPNADMQQTSVTTKNQKQMYQTSYKSGQKASFFPSTATATTNGTSQDNGSNDPRRQTAAEGTRGNNNFNG